MARIYVSRKKCFECDRVHGIKSALGNSKMEFSNSPGKEFIKIFRWINKFCPLLLSCLMKAGHAHQTLRISESTLKAAQIHKIFSWI